MEVWLETLGGSGHDGVDAIFAKDDTSGIYVNDGILYRNGSMIGGHVHIHSEETQTKARSLAGSVEWILLTFEDWSMIPIENILAATEATPTKVAAQINQPIQAQGAGLPLISVLMPCCALMTALKHRLSLNHFDSNKWRNLAL